MEREQIELKSATQLHLEMQLEQLEILKQDHLTFLRVEARNDLLLQTAQRSAAALERMATSLEALVNKKK